MIGWLVGRAHGTGRTADLTFKVGLGRFRSLSSPFPFPLFSAHLPLPPLSATLFLRLCVCVQMGGENKQELQMRHFLIAEPFWAIGCFPFPNSPPPSSPLPLFTLLTFIIHLVIFCRPPSSSLSPSPLPIKPLSFSFLLYFFLLYFFFFAFLSYYYHYHAFPPLFFSLSLS